MNLRSIGQQVFERRTALGLTQERLGKLCNLSRSTINQLENGSLSDLGVKKLEALLEILNLSLEAKVRGTTLNALELASRTASVSYKTKILKSDLEKVLVTGKLSKKVLPHIATLLDEAPLALLVAAVEQAALRSHITAKKIWSNIDLLARELHLPRQVWK
ncbi:helix-turn-helix domain-containing protein [Polynucleobacter antarcticus]|nr:helix-turn-helix transcriptional regulator [Polynucleobacter antarcticus]